MKSEGKPRDVGGVIVTILPWGFSEPLIEINLQNSLKLVRKNLPRYPRPAEKTTPVNLIRLPIEKGVVFYNL